jgi:hypothetical protein
MEVCVNPVAVKRTGTAVAFTCYRWGHQRHISRNCRRPAKEKENFNNGKLLGKERKLTVNS